jgi:DNA-binding CsgD family transcriptional regulator
MTIITVQIMVDGQPLDLIDGQAGHQLAAGASSTMPALALQDPPALYGGIDISPGNLRMLPYLAAGLTYKQIGHELHLAPSTVKTHIYQLAAKLGVNGSVAVVTWSILSGTLPIDSILPIWQRYYPQLIRYDNDR